MMALLPLEDFENSDDPERLIARPARLWAELEAAARAEGEAAGQARAEASDAAQRTALQAELVQAFQDLDVTHQEMRQHVLSGIEDLIRLLADVLVPELANQGLADHLAREIGAMVADASDVPLQVRVPSGHAAALSEALSGSGPSVPDIVESNDLAPGQAQILGTANLREIDPAQAGEAIRALIQSFLNQSQDTEETPGYG